MRKGLLFLVCCFWFIVGRTQYVTIPDTAFANWLDSSGFHQCLSGNLLDTTCLTIDTITFLNLENRDFNDITGIQYFDNLKKLYCGGNNLIFLPSLPNTLEELDCGHNLLTSLPDLPTTLNRLFCENNQISTLPILPISLKMLNCDNNSLVTLPDLPNGLTDFSCESNDITEIPTLPSTLMNLSVSWNPNLQCLPVLNEGLILISTTGTSITCMPNLPSSLLLYPLPICDSSNLYSCSYCHAYFAIYPDSLNPGVYFGFNQSEGDNFTSYLWEFGDGDFSTLQYPTHTYVQSGQYYVCLTASGPTCTSTYCDSSFLVFKTDNGLMSQLNILNPTGIYEVTNPQFSLSPNTANNQLNINSSVPIEQINIYSTTGQLMLETKQPLNNTIDVSGLSKGVYITAITPKSPKGDLNAIMRRWVKM